MHHSLANYLLSDCQSLPHCLKLHDCLRTQYYVCLDGYASERLQPVREAMPARLAASCTGSFIAISVVTGQPMFVAAITIVDYGWGSLYCYV